MQECLFHTGHQKKWTACLDLQAFSSCPYSAKKPRNKHPFPTKSHHMLVALNPTSIVAIRIDRGTKDTTHKKKGTQMRRKKVRPFPSCTNGIKAVQVKKNSLVSNQDHKATPNEMK